MTTVGFLSLLNEPEIQPKKRKSNPQLDTLQSESDKFEPLLAYKGFIEKKSATRWRTFWGECTLSGSLVLKKKQDDDKPIKQYRLKHCSILKQKLPNSFTLQRSNKSATTFRTETSDECNIWVPTLSVIICSLLYIDRSISHYIFYYIILTYYE